MRERLPDDAVGGGLEVPEDGPRAAGDDQRHRQRLSVLIDVGGRAPADQTALAPEEGAEVTLVLGAEDSGPKRFGHSGLAGGRRRNSREEQRQCNDGSGPFHPGIRLG